VVTALLFAAGQLLASEVTNVELQYSSGSTVATINVDGAIRFTHQTEQAKDGKPFRVIVDILTATHQLGANNFMSLPDCPIRAIRTSQYSIKPEAIVRVVFDMEAEQVYRVESNGNTITLWFADKAQRSFETWSTVSPTPVKTRPKTETKVASAPPAGDKSAKELNQSIKKDRMTSLQPKTASPASAAVAKEESKPVRTQPVAATSAKPVAAVDKKAKKSPSELPQLSKSDTHYGPYVDATLLDKEKQPVKTSVPATTQAPAANKPMDTKPVTVARKETPAPVKKTEVKAPALAKPQSAELAKTESQQAQPKPVAQVDDKAAKADTEAADKRSTSRFRRAPLESKKIKGTLVAEFPKRLVIKYKAVQHRDPFATLIDESKTHDDPIERQVPDVEGLKLVGVIEAGSKDNRALFEDDEGYGYILQSGDKVQKGYVLRVEADRVYFQIFEYGWSRTVALHLES